VLRAMQCERGSLVIGNAMRTKRCSKDGSNFLQGLTPRQAPTHGLPCMMPKQRPRAPVLAVLFWHHALGSGLDPLLELGVSGLGNHRVARGAGNLDSRCQGLVPTWHSLVGVGRTHERRE
jgi:hypothetical protein